jgi:AraC family transcriptional regulator
VKYACEELALPENDLATVALSAGFSDQSHFTRVFKNITGITPGNFRQIAIDEK